MKSRLQPLGLGLSHLRSEPRRQRSLRQLDPYATSRFQRQSQSIHIRYNSSQQPNRPQSTSPPKADQLNQESTKGKPLGDKLAKAWSTPTKWYPIPIALGALVLLAVQYRKQTREELEVESQGEGGAVVKARNNGPWQVRVLGALPLRSLSQLWGYLNGLVLPVWFRPFGFKLYAKIFGCNLDEVPEDLTSYDSLGSFFYREMKKGQRPIADAPMVSPADGRVLHFGEIVGEKVEQVKGMTYSLEALLGQQGQAVGKPTEVIDTRQSKSKIVDDQHFANINDIPYSLSSLLGAEKSHKVDESSLHIASDNLKGLTHEHDASHPPETQDLSHDASVAMKLGTSAISTVTDTRDSKSSTQLPLLNPNNKLFFFVVYLAPGDYHRFHSPTSWVVERRRHFTGDLFSVSPYIANRLKDLFVLNERVALLGRWKYGFYSMVPVGATNVGSIRINFDESLRTNTRKLSHPPHTYTEAVYSSASAILRGQPLLAGEEMGGFRLGSTIVLVFEAPKEWTFTVKAGELIKVGEPLGEIKNA